MRTRTILTVLLIAILLSVIGWYWYFANQLPYSNAKMTECSWGIGLTGFFGVAFVNVKNEGVTVLRNLTLTASLYYNSSGTETLYGSSSAPIDVIEPNQTVKADVVIPTGDGSIENRTFFWNVTSRLDSTCKLVLTSANGVVLDEWSILGYGAVPLWSSKTTVRQ